MIEPLILSQHQADVLVLYAEGHNAITAGEKLHYSTGTVRGILRDIRRRTGAKNTNQLLYWYGRWGAVVEDCRGNNQYQKNKGAVAA